MEGLLNKYIIKKTNGKSIDPDAIYFVLRVDKKQKDKNHLQACIKALYAYANSIYAINPKLSKDIIHNLLD